MEIFSTDLPCWCKSLVSWVCGGGAGGGGGGGGVGWGASGVGNPPPPRASMGFASALKSLYVFGGVGESGAALHLLVIY